jgi:hypothetical protein
MSLFVLFCEQSLFGIKNLLQPASRKSDVSQKPSTIFQTGFHRTLNQGASNGDNNFKHHQIESSF